MKVSSDIFFLIKNEEFIVWNFDSHEQFSLDYEHAKRLLEICFKIRPERRDSQLIDEKFLTHSITHNAPRPEADWGWDDLARIFHFGTKNLTSFSQPASEEEWAIEYIDHCNNLDREKFPKSQPTPENCIPLPPPVAAGKSVEDILKKRKTCRDFYERSVTLDSLSTILHWTLRFQKREDSTLSNDDFSHRRYSPTGGGLTATRGYLYVRDVENLKPGFYKYHDNAHSLELLSEQSTTLGAFVNGQHFANKAACAIFLTSRLERLWWKYKHSRTYRMALIEIGHHSQTALLATAAVGLSSWITGALCESLLEKELNLTDPSEEIFFCIAIGHGSGEHIPHSINTAMSP